MSTPLPQFHTHSCDCDSDSDSELHPMNSLLSPQSATATAAGDPHFRRHHMTSLNTDVIIRQLPSEGLSFQLWPAATTLFTLLDNRLGRHYSRRHPRRSRHRHRLTPRHPQMEGVTVGREYELIMGSDVVYHDHLYDPLLETLKYFLLSNNNNEEKQVVFLMAHLKRWKKERLFFRRARKLFDVDVIHRDCPDHGKRVGVIVYRFVGKRNQRKSTDLSKKS